MQTFKTWKCPKFQKSRGKKYIFHLQIYKNSTSLQYLSSYFFLAFYPHNYALRIMNYTFDGSPLRSKSNRWIPHTIMHYELCIMNLSWHVRLYERGYPNYAVRRLILVEKNRRIHIFTPLEVIENAIHNWAIQFFILHSNPQSSHGRFFAYAHQSAMGWHSNRSSVVK